MDHAIPCHYASADDPGACSITGAPCTEDPESCPFDPERTRFDEFHDPLETRRPCP